MKMRNKIATIVLFLAALVVGLDAQPGWSQWTPPNPPYAQCTINTSADGLAVLPDGRVLVATPTGLAYFSSFPSNPSQCPTSTPVPIPGLAKQYRSLTIGLDGKVYGFRYNPDSSIDFVSINPSAGTDKTLILNMYGLGMTLDPIAGDLYITAYNSSRNTIYRITGLYGPNPAPTQSPFATVVGAVFDGLAWSCDGRYLFAASPDTDQVFRFDRLAGYIFANLPARTGPDGITVGAAGTTQAGYVFTNDRDGTVTKIRNLPGSLGQQIIIASGGQGGDFAFVDAQGAMVAIQGDHLQRLSSQYGQWVLPGSSLCSDLRCSALAATTPQIDNDNQACLTGLDANLVLTLSQSACGSCESCSILNQARITLGALLDTLPDLDAPAPPPPACPGDLKLALQSLYQSCPCSPAPFACPVSVVAPCPTCIPFISRLRLDPGYGKTRFPFGIDFESYDPILQAFMREAMSP